MIDFTINNSITDSLGNDELGVLGRVKGQLSTHIGETDLLEGSECVFKSWFNKKWL